MPKIYYLFVPYPIIGNFISLCKFFFASGGQGDSFRENRPPGPPVKAFHYLNNLIINPKGNHGLHQDTFKLQTMIALIKSFCGGAICKTQSAGRKANNTINAVRQAPSSMRLPPWPPEAKMK
jgi:hypothetical protein